MKDKFPAAADLLGFASVTPPVTDPVQAFPVGT